MKTARAFLFLTLLPVAAIAGPWDGTYRQGEDADCTRVGVEGAAIRIQDNTFYGNEAVCQMRQPIEVRNMHATLYDMYCEGYLGEDGQPPQPWEARTMVMRGPDEGLYMIWDGYAFQFDRCTAEDMVEALIGDQPEDLPASGETEADVTETPPADPDN